MTTNIERYIDHLFYTKGSVTLDGIGTISLERVPAVITPNQKEILPPKSIFQFSDDEAYPHQLKELIMESEGLSGNTAGALVDKYTQDILKKLIDYNIVKVSDIGYLEKTNEGVSFTASQQSLDQVYYGLPILPLNPISKDSVNVAGSVLVKTDTVQEASKNEWLNYLGALLLGAIMILAYHYYIDPFPNTQNKTGASEVSTKVLDQLVENDNNNEVYLTDSEVVKEELTNTNPSELESEVSSQSNEIVASADVEDSSNVILAKPSSETECVIIVGVFTRTINALELSDRIKNDGYTPYIEDINDTQRVGISFKCANHDLEVMINDIRKKYNKKAWYLVPQISI